MAVFTAPAVITFPNVFNAAPGTKLTVLSFDHTTGQAGDRRHATGVGRRQDAISDPGQGVTTPGWHGLAPPGPTPRSDKPKPPGPGPAGPDPDPESWIPAIQPPDPWGPDTHDPNDPDDPDTPDDPPPESPLIRRRMIRRRPTTTTE